MACPVGSTRNKVKFDQMGLSGLKIQSHQMGQPVARLFCLDGPQSNGSARCNLVLPPQIYQNLNESRHYLVYRFIQNLKKRHLFLDGESSIIFPWQQKRSTARAQSVHDWLLTSLVLVVCATWNLVCGLHLTA